MIWAFYIFGILFLLVCYLCYAFSKMHHYTTNFYAKEKIYVNELGNYAAKIKIGTLFFIPIYDWFSEYNETGKGTERIVTVTTSTIEELKERLATNHKETLHKIQMNNNERFIKSKIKRVK